MTLERPLNESPSLLGPPRLDQRAGEPGGGPGGEDGDARCRFERATKDPFGRHQVVVGGVRDPMESFVAFRGRKPTIDALLRHSGITE